MKLKTIFKELHLYNGKIEYLIKLLIWVLCWIGGVYVMKDKTEGVGSAYFIFSLALLMEFAPKIAGKKENVARILHSLFCFMISAILVMSALILFNKNNETYHNIMYILSIIVMGYLIIDCSILWICMDEENNANQEELKKDVSTEERIQKFNEALMTGNLGDLTEEVK